MSQLLLALDASPRSHFCIALWGAGRPPRQQCHEVAPGSTGRGHVEQLSVKIADLMAAEQVDFSDLSRIAVNTGPGSFSGVRAGCATARGLAQAGGLPITGIGLMELWAARAVQEGADADILLAALPAGENLFVQAFERRPETPRPVGEATSLTVEEAAAYCRQFSSLALLGSGADRLATALTGATALPCRILRLPEPDAILLASQAALRPPTAGLPAPVYLRPPDARLPQPAGQAKIVAPAGKSC